MRYSSEVTICAAVSSRCIIETLFLHDIVTSKQYVEILHESSENALGGLSATSCFMQDGAKPPPNC